MDDEIKPKLYLCPLCGKNKKAVFKHKKGGKVLLPGNVYIIGMCSECLQLALKDEIDG